MSTYNGATSWLSGAIATDLPTGYPIQFGQFKLSGSWGAGTVQRNGAASYASCTITPKSIPVYSLKVYSPIIQFADWTYRALPDSSRSPTGWATWAFEFLVAGDSDAVMAYKNEFAARSGYAYRLRFSGAESLLSSTYSQFYSKECKAEMGPIEGIQEYPEVSPTPLGNPTKINKSHCIIRVMFQQLSDFSAVS